ncbi:glycosyl transferase, partial [Rhizobium ruizarguesonis]
GQFRVGNHALCWVHTERLLQKLMKTAKRFVGPEIEGWTGDTYITLPGVALSSVFFSTDVIMLFFIAIALLAYFGLKQRRSVGLALVMG